MTAPRARELTPPAERGGKIRATRSGDIRTTLPLTIGRSERCRAEMRSWLSAHRSAARGSCSTPCGGTRRWRRRCARKCTTSSSSTTGARTCIGHTSRAAASGGVEVRRLRGTTWPSLCQQTRETAFDPAMKLLAILRDPVERALSHHAHVTGRGPTRHCRYTLQGRSPRRRSAWPAVRRRCTRRGTTTTSGTTSAATSGEGATQINWRRGWYTSRAETCSCCVPRILRRTPPALYRPNIAFLGLPVRRVATRRYDAHAMPHTPPSMPGCVQVWRPTSRPTGSECTTCWRGRD